VTGAQSDVRLAELVAALSLGIHLGFGQPMEHVLRQCLIAVRLAGRIGPDPDERAGLYYTALLVGVGCHTDATSRRPGRCLRTSPASVVKANVVDGVASVTVDLS
jgi:hypothetical protein